MSAQPEPEQGLSARLNQPLIAVVVEEDGQDIVSYFVDEKEADAFVKERRRAGSVESLAGAWSYMDEDEVLDSLDRIRHESRPTPLLDNI